jgi:3-oxocholest-4-en-26-oyl-CoA dehydrogenase beta subunit
MDFSFTEEEQDVAELSRRILEDKVTHERLTDIESRDGPRFDPELWRALADADLLSVGLPGAAGGMGLGLLAQCLVLEQVGRTLAPVPVLPSIVMGAMAIAQHGTADQRDEWVPPAATGEKILTAALAEPVSHDRQRPATTASRDGSGWRLDGTKTAVPAATLADLMLIPATTADGGTGVFLVDRSVEGLTVTPQQLTTGDVAGHVDLEGVVVHDDALLGADQDGDALQSLLDLATVGLCTLQLGVTERALDETAEYSKNRIQFERPIATFQAVGHRCADAYIDVEAIRLTLWQAIWRLSEGLPASLEIETAKFWAAEGGHRVAHAAVHIHGGMGVATEYFIHRYFLHAKQLEFALGGASEQALRIGDQLAAQPA